MFQRPCLKRRSGLVEKKYISGYIGHKSFIQTVKCFYFTQIILNQSFFGALLTFSYILLKGKVLCFACFSKPHKSLVKSFIKTVKCSFFNQIIVNQSFYGALLTFSYFYFKEKFCVASASHLRDTYLQVSIRHSDLVEKKYTSGYI